jgi:UDP-N-acetylmuramate dehydrogenase
MPLGSYALTALRGAFKERLLLDEPLAKHTSARIGGPADAFLIARNADELEIAAALAWKHSEALFILGGGSNILISDKGMRGLVVHNQAEEVQIDGVDVLAESGASTIHLARRCAQQGLAGLEWAIGVPGTIGGAAYGNAGAHNGSMASIVTRIRGMTPNGEVSMNISQLSYQYRSSILKREHRRCVIGTVEMRLMKDKPAAIQERMKEYSEYRKRTQPSGATIGSMFKNPPGDFAGRLIEAARLQGTKVGGAEISDIHANFFVNSDNATAADVKALADLASNEVFDRFGIRLELEIELVGVW